MSKTLSGYKIGFIGLGTMGAPMAGHFHDAGAEMIVWNRSVESAMAAAEKGMVAAPDPVSLAEVVGAGIICLNLTHTEVVEGIVDLMCPVLAPGTLVIDFGTTGHSETLEFSRRVAEKAAHWVDAPVSGGELGAKAANLTVMAGGDSAALERATPLFEVIGEKITFMGEVGSGQVTKLANQLIVAQTIDAVAQALSLAEKAGVDSALVREALRGGFAESRILDLHGDRMIRRDFAPGGRSELQLKDVRLMAELAEGVGLDSSTLKNSLSLWEQFVEEKGCGDLDHSGIFRLYEDS